MRTSLGSRLLPVAGKHLDLAVAKQMQASQLGGKSIATPYPPPPPRPRLINWQQLPGERYLKRWEEIQRQGVRGLAGDVCRGWRGPGCGAFAQSA